MKYRIRPDYICAAFRITEIRGRWENGNIALTLENGDQVEALKDMTARMQPKVGDYWVIAPDGYVYLNPKKTFEEKHVAVAADDDPAVWQGVDHARPGADESKVQVFDAEKPQQGLMTMTPAEETAYANKQASASMLPEDRPLGSARASQSRAQAGVRSSNSKKGKK